MKTSCISHPPKTPLIIIREEYLAICDGDHCEAAILNQFEYWTNIKLGYQEQAETEREIARAGGLEGPESDVWVYKSQTELHEELMGLFGIRAIGTALQSLVDRGFLERRNNPKYAWDRTYQYRLQTSVVQDAILQKCKFDKAEAQPQKPPKDDIEPTETEAALPEITSEITSEETKEKKDSASPEKPAGRTDAEIVADVIEQTKTHKDIFDLSLETVTGREKAGGDYASPPSAGGGDAAAEAALVAMYGALGSEPPRRDSASWKSEFGIISQILRDRDTRDIATARSAGWHFGLDNREAPQFANVHLSTFPSSFGVYVGKAKKQTQDAAGRRGRLDADNAEAQAAFEERRATEPPQVEGDPVWEQAKREIALQMTRATFDKWVSRTRGLGRGDGVYVVVAPDAQARDWLDSRLRTTAERTLVGIFGERVEVRFEVESKSDG